MGYLPIVGKTILLVASVSSFAPQYARILSHHNFSGISPAWIFFNLLATTTQFTWGLHLTVMNKDVVDTIVHTPPTAGDYVNLVQFAVVWLAHVFMFLLYLRYQESQYRMKVLLTTLYLVILVALLAPILYESGLDPAHDSGEWYWRGIFATMYGTVYVFFLIPFTKALVLLSFFPQARKILSRPSAVALSPAALAVQTVLFFVVGIAWSNRITFDRNSWIYGKDLCTPVQWVVQENVGFAVVQGLLFFLWWEKSRGDVGGGDETRPLLSS